MAQGGDRRTTEDKIDFKERKKIWLQYKNMARDSRTDASTETILLVVHN